MSQLRFSFTKFFSLFVIIILVGCGAKRSRTDLETDRGKDTYVIASDEVATGYLPLDYVQYNDCLPIEDDFQLLFESFSLGQYLNYEFNIFPYLSNHKLKKFPFSPFNQIRRNRHEQYIFFKGGINHKLMSEGNDIKFCGQSDFYNKMTVQGAALNAYKFSNKVYQLAKPVLGRRIKPIALNVAPVIEKQVHQLKGKRKIAIKRYYQVDNATYTYYGQGKGAINLLPQGDSELSKYRFNGIPLWSIPMVAAHEYGHHLFLSLFLGKLIEKDIKFKKDYTYHSNCFHNSERKILKKRNIDVPGKLKQYYLVLDAFNEGFADLLGSLALTQQERSLTGISGLAENREINSYFFDNEDRKVLSLTVINKYFNQSHGRYADSHSIGAILAYNLNYQMSIYGLNETERVRFLLKWFLKLSREINSVSRFTHMSATNFGKYIYNSFIKHLVRLHPSEQKSLNNLCKDSEVNLPVFHPIKMCQNSSDE